MRTLSLPDLSAAQNEIVRIAFTLILQTGRAVPASVIHARRQMTSSTIDVELAALVSAGRVRRDVSGDVSGALGLSLDATRHRISIQDSQWFTWCAIDALGILGALDATGAIHSESPHSGRSIAITFRDGKPDGGDLSSVVYVGAYRPGTPVVDQWCPTVNFFEDEAAAHAWADQHNLAGDCVGLLRAAELAADRWRQRLQG